jgi:SET domain-containing protein
MSQSIIKTKSTTESLLAIRDSTISGSGVFSTRPIPKGEVVHTLNGEHISKIQCYWRIATGRLPADSPLQTGRHRYLELDQISKSINHSCQPNCILAKVSTLIAVRDIETGEEITYDYSMTVAPGFFEYFFFHMKCECRAPTCRRIIRNISRTPRSIILWHIGCGGLQDYMKAIVNIAPVKPNAAPFNP